MRYYVPSIEEFYPGFEYELYGDPVRHKTPETAEKWMVKIYSGLDFVRHYPESHRFDMSLFDEYKKKGHIRVKKLSGYDIKDLGWKLEQEEKVGKHLRYLYSKKVKYTRGTHECRLLHVPATDWILIFFPLGELSVPENNENEDTVVFAGKVKNKSELKRLFQMLQIQ